MAEDADDDVDKCDQVYLQGRRAVWRRLFEQAFQELGYSDDDPKSELAKMIVEREDAIAALREACREHGDNDWPDDLNLGDVIDKHLVRHL